jgi:hypothetical protein
MNMNKLGQKEDSGMGYEPKPITTKSSISELKYATVSFR